VTGVINSDGSIEVDWHTVNDAQAYLIHYGDANEADPNDAVYMGYTETNSWILVAGDVPSLASGDKIYLYVQTYREKGIGATDVEKARYLHDGKFSGSSWSDPIILEKG